MSSMDLGRRAFSSPSSLGMIEESLLRSQTLLRQQTERILEYPKNVWIESSKIWRIAFPAMLTRVSTFGVLVVTQAFIGHIGATQLAAYAFIQILGVRLVNGIMIGMSSATETLCGQAFGAKQYHMLGIYLQRSWIVNLVTATVFVPLFCFATPILKLLGEEDAIAESAESIGLWFIPILYSYVFSYTIMQYLQSQLKNLVLGWLATAAFMLHMLLSWIFVYELNWGVSGAMSAMSISTWSMMVGLFVYIFGGCCPNTWKGFTLAAFADLWPVMKMSASSGIMQCLELWYTAILVLIASYMQNASVIVSAFSICVNIVAFVFMICLGFQASVSVRVSNELGEGNAKAASYSVKINLANSLGVGVIFAVLCLFLGRQISLIFTSEEDVVEVVSSLSVLLALTILVYSAQPVYCGVAIGCGRQTMAAWVNFVSFYVIGIPLGVILAYVALWEVKGMWIGLLIGLATQTIILAIVVWRTNWEEQVEKAQERLNRWFFRVPGDEEDDENLTKPNPLID